MLIKDLEITNSVKVVAVTKNRTIEEINNIYSQGCRDFGENKLQELEEKVDSFPDVNWHFIGRIQSKKIPKIVKHSYLIHSISEFKQIEKTNNAAKNINKVQNILLQINISLEETKGGFLVEEIEEAVTLARSLENLNLVGFMVMGDNTNDTIKIEHTFKTAKKLFDHYELDILSMGMSGDYNLAIKCGSNCVRVGSILF